jgi:hypothetical protein
MGTVIDIDGIKRKTAIYNIMLQVVKEKWSGLVVRSHGNQGGCSGSIPSACTILVKVTKCKVLIKDHTVFFNKQRPKIPLKVTVLLKTEML